MLAVADYSVGANLFVTGFSWDGFMIVSDLMMISLQNCFSNIK